MPKRAELKDNDTKWVRIPYQVTIGKQFSTLRDSLLYMLDTNENGQIKYNEGVSNAYVGSNDEYIKKFVGMEGSASIGNPYYKDTRLGANDAINCLWQFNRDDDIVHPINYTDGKADGLGMGRVYASTIERNQSIAWFTFGVAKFTNLVAFYTKSFEKELVNMNNTGFTAGGLGAVLGNIVGAAISIPITPLRWAVNWLCRLRNYHVDRFYDLRTTMHLYYKYVDAVLVAWLVNAGIYTTTSAEGESHSWKADPATLPAALAETGPSIWNVMSRKCHLLSRMTGRESPFKDSAAFEKEVARLVKMSPEKYDAATDAATQAWSGRSGDKNKQEGVNWGSLLWQSGMGATQYVGFRVEKSVGASESWSNSTAPSEFAQKINAQAAEARSKAFELGGSTIGESVSQIPLVGQLVQGISSFASEITKSFGMDGVASAIIGGAFIDIPERYQSSDFNKSHSLSFQLRAPYGDVISIYQSIIVPLAMIMCGTLPRAAGANSYMQPFLCRVYCKGMFSIPLGIIDSLSIKRGSSEFGWTYQNLPTCIDVDISIKDLSPVMYMGLKDDVFKSLFATNTSFDEYLLTLAGVGLWERVSRFAQIRRNAQILSHRIRHTVFNPMFYSDLIADSTLIQAICSFWPNSQMPKN